jgi:hypothetical protein
MTEVVLRNSIHRAATAAFSRADWYQDVLKRCGDIAWQAKVAADPLLPQEYYRKAVPPHNKKSIWVGSVQKKLRHWRSPAEAKLEDVLKRLTNDGKAHTPDQVIAHAMFGFWLDLSDPSFESTTNPHALWPQCLPTVFPHDPTMTRLRLRTSLERIKRLRNRVSHHEPAWKLAAALTPAGVHASLGAQVQDMRDMLSSMVPGVVGLLENSGTFGRLRWLLDPQTIASFAGQAAATKIDHRALNRKVRKVATAARRALDATSSPQPGQVLELCHGNRALLTILPHA